jgi:hypothetical protein
VAFRGFDYGVNHPDRLISHLGDCTTEIMKTRRSKVLCNRCVFKDRDEDLPLGENTICLFKHYWFMTVRDHRQCLDFEDEFYDERVHLSH